MITETGTVYTLQRDLHVTGKAQPIHLQTFFVAKDRNELDELLDLFNKGRTDPRIVEQDLPEQYFTPGTRKEWCWISLTTPDGRCLNDQYTDYPWGGAKNER